MATSIVATREPIAAALLGVIQNAYQWKSDASRKVKLWGDVAANLRPAAFLQEPGERRVSQSLVLTKRTLQFKVIVYTATQPDKPGSTLLNEIVDAIDAALEPSGAEKLTGRRTLGLPIQHVQIADEVLIFSGDLDGDGMAIIPITVLLP